MAQEISTLLKSNRLGYEVELTEEISDKSFYELDKCHLAIKKKFGNKIIIDLIQTAKEQIK
jgi:hypothetical protein